MQEYPRMVYRKHETAVVETEEELASMIAQGWTTRPGGLSEASILKARIAETETELDIMRQNLAAIETREKSKMGDRRVDMGEKNQIGDGRGEMGEKNQRGDGRGEMGEKNQIGDGRGEMGEEKSAVFPKGKKT